MCGIAGFVHFDPTRAADPNVARRMADTLKHRGPDGEGALVDGNVALAHRRLSIIDVDGGVQPMTSFDGRAVITYNGELYNYLELRNELRRAGRHFRTDSDTEVVLQAYQHWGSAFQNRLNGMWALAIWNRDTRELLLSRDRFGEKPLYWAIYDETFIFGSELKALHAFGVPRNADWSLLELYLSVGYIPAPWSFHLGTHKLPPAHSLSVAGNRAITSRYWSLPTYERGEQVTDSVKAGDGFRELFSDSVRLRMRSDVSFGAFLSGGLDSSSVVALMSAQSNSPTHTFTIGFDDVELDERVLARAVATRYRTEHREATVSPGSVSETVRRILRHTDEPFGDSSAIAVDCISGIASSTVKMVLTGDGGDEALSGYPSYQSLKANAFLATLPAKRLWTGMIDLGAGAPGAFGTMAERVARSVRLSKRPFRERMAAKFATSGGGPDVVKSLVDTASAVSVLDVIDDRLSQRTSRNDFDRLATLDLTLHLPDDMLVKVDRLTMAHSLEARSPFLDHRLVEFLLSVHPSVKLPWLQRKAVLRRAMKTDLPAELFSAPKRGFSVPLKRWFRDGELDRELLSLTQIDAPIQRGNMLRLIDQHKSGRKNLGEALWRLLVLRTWCAVK